MHTFYAIASGFAGGAIFMMILGAWLHSVETHAMMEFEQFKAALRPFESEASNRVDSTVKAAEGK